MAIGPHPWRKLNHNAALNQPDVDWFNAVTTALYTFGVRYGTEEFGYVERPNTDGQGWNLVLPQSLLGDGGSLKGSHHLKITIGDTTNIKVLGGSRIRDVIGADNRVQLSGDVGLAPTEDLFKTVAIAASVFVWVEFNDALVPATLAVQTGAAYPTPDATSEKLVLGYVTFAGGEITAIEQYWTGGDWRDQWEVYDGNSLGYNAANRTEVYDFDAAAPETITNYVSDLILFKDYGDGKMAYTNMTLFSTALLAYWAGLPTYPLAWSQLWDTVGDPTQAGNAGYVPIVTDQGGGVFRLELLYGGPGSGNGPWWKLGNTSPVDAYGQFIGNLAQNTVIAVDLQRLTNAGGASWTLDWAARELDGADWTALAGTILKSADTTVAASGDGALEIPAGGAYLGAGLWADKGGSAQAGFFADGATSVALCDGGVAGYLTDGVATVTIADGVRAGTFARGAMDVNLATATAAGNFTDGTRTANLADGTYAIDATGGVNVVAADEYFHDDVAGDTLTDGGNNLVSGGIVTNEASWTFWTIQVVVPGSGVKQLRVLALDVS